MKIVQVAASRDDFVAVDSKGNTYFLQQLGDGNSYWEKINENENEEEEEK